MTTLFWDRPDYLRSIVFTMNSHNHGIAIHFMASSVSLEESHTLWHADETLTLGPVERAMRLGSIREKMQASGFFPVFPAHFGKHGQ